MDHVSKRDIQKLYGDFNIETIIAGCLADGCSAETVHRTVINYILAKLFPFDKENEEPDEKSLDHELNLPDYIKRDLLEDDDDIS